MVDQLADLFRTTHKPKTHQVVKTRGHHCGDIELVGYLPNTTGPGPLVMDLRVPHHRVGSSVDPVLNGHLRYPNNLDQSLNDTPEPADKLRKYHDDYNFNPHRGVGCMSSIVSTSDHQSDRGFFHYHHSAFSSMIKSRVGNILVKASVLRINLNTEVSHSPFTLANFSSFNLVFVFRCSSSTTNPVSERRVDSSFLVLSLSSHRYQYISNKQLYLSLY